MLELFLILSILVLTLLSGYFSGSEIALFSIPNTKIKTYETDADSRKRLIAELVLHPRHLIVTIFLLNTLVNILIQNVTSSLFGTFGHWALKIGIPLVLTLVFGEIIPKYIALQNNVAIAHKVAPSISFLQKLLEPLCRFIVYLTVPISRILFFFLKRDKSISDEELQHVLKASQEHGVLHPDEAELINGFLDIQKDRANELMCQREDMHYYDLKEPLSRLIHLFFSEKCSRIPVCDHGIENVLGILTATQFFLNKERLKSPHDLIPYLQKPFFIPETTSAKMLLRRMKRHNEEMALLVDEYGSISGLITQEDLIELFIGKIADRKEQTFYTKTDEGVIIASGKLELETLNELFDVQLESENHYLTIGGWLTEQLGDIPKSGTTYETRELFFQVLSADPNRIRRLYIRRKSAPKPPKAGGKG
jgi:putative hemolysin